MLLVFSLSSQICVCILFKHTALYEILMVQGD